MKKIIFLVAAGLFPISQAAAQPLPPAMAHAPTVQIQLAPNKKNDLFAAVKAGHPNEVKQLLDKSKAPGLLANVKDEHDNTPLIIAAEKGYFEIVKLLVDKGAYVASANEKNQTALCLAAKNKRVKTVKFLAKRDGIRVNYKCGPEGETAGKLYPLV